MSVNLSKTHARILLEVIQMHDVVGLEGRIAETALLPVGVPSLAGAHSIDHARVDGDGSAVKAVFFQEVHVLLMAVENNVDEVGEG